MPLHCEQAYHMYYLLMPSLETRSRFIAHLGEKQIKAVFHYLPLHLSEYARQWGGREGDCFVAESASERIVRLPFYTDLGEQTQAVIIEAILEFS